MPTGIPFWLVSCSSRLVPVCNVLMMQATPVKDPTIPVRMVRPFYIGACLKMAVPLRDIDIGGFT